MQFDGSPVPEASRALVPPERVTRTHVLKPAVCRGCGQPLRGDDPAPHRHQVIDLPKVVATVDEYQVHRIESVKWDPMKKRLGISETV